MGSTSSSFVPTDKIIAYFEAGLSQPEFFVKQLEIFSLIDHPSSLIIKDLLRTSSFSRTHCQIP